MLPELQAVAVRIDPYAKDFAIFTMSGGFVDDELYVEGSASFTTTGGAFRRHLYRLAR